MKKFQRGMLCLMLLSGLMFFSKQVRAQDPVKLNPGNHKILVDDDHVRVYEVIIPPGQKVAVHSHPRHVVYALSGGTLTLTKDGKSEAVTIKEGDAMDMPAESHSTENTGSTEVKLVVVEIKKDMGMKGKMMKDKNKMKKDKAREY
ncbi:MAG TPA: cupin domain-containing protein [Sphingobacteriaceae bacterium]